MIDKTLEHRVRAAVNAVLDPCSIGRGVPAGLVDMGMVCGIDIDERPQGRARVSVNVRITSPGCTFVLYFENQIRARLEQLDELDGVAIVWSNRFDWSDDDMSDELKERLRRKREAVLERARTEGKQLPVLAG